MIAFGYSLVTGIDHGNDLVYHHILERRRRLRHGDAGSAGLRSIPKTTHSGVLSDSAASNKKVKLVWLGFGTAEPERMYKSVHGLHGELEQAGIKQVYYKSRGTAHEWQTWRRDLNDSARRLFQ
ncbi:MAG: enterochelin esterase-like enzyme [Bryobacterales bacterium]|nr:enterochelin esterase-like enzyme [Bryobacterales bacterium]